MAVRREVSATQTAGQQVFSWTTAGFLVCDDGTGVGYVGLSNEPDAVDPKFKLIQKPFLAQRMRSEKRDARTDAELLKYAHETMSIKRRHAKEFDQYEQATIAYLVQFKSRGSDGRSSPDAESVQFSANSRAAMIRSDVAPSRRTTGWSGQIVNLAISDQPAARDIGFYAQSGYPDHIDKCLAYSSAPGVDESKSRKAGQAIRKTTCYARWGGQGQGTDARSRPDYLTMGLLAKLANCHNLMAEPNNLRLQLSQNDSDFRSDFTQCLANFCTETMLFGKQEIIAKTRPLQAKVLVTWRTGVDIQAAQDKARGIVIEICKKYKVVYQIR